MRGMRIEQAPDVYGATIKVNDIVRRARGCDVSDYRVIALTENNGGVRKARVKRMNATLERLVSWVETRNLRKLNDAQAKAALDRENARRADIGRAIEGGVADAIRSERDRMENAIRRAPATQVVCQNTIVAPQPKPASTLDRPIAERYVVELWYGERTVMHAVIDSQTKEIVEQFTERDMARDAARMLNLR